MARKKFEVGRGTVAAAAVAGVVGLILIGRSNGAPAEKPEPGNHNTLSPDQAARKALCADAIGSGLLATELGERGFYAEWAINSTEIQADDQNSTGRVYYIHATGEVIHEKSGDLCSYEADTTTGEPIPTPDQPLPDAAQVWAALSALPHGK
jgi:hypothetical protein